MRSDSELIDWLQRMAASGRVVRTFQQGDIYFVNIDAGSYYQDFSGSSLSRALSEAVDGYKHA